MNENQSKIALVYTLFDRAVNGKTYISKNELHDIMRLAINQFEYCFDKNNPDVIGKLYEYGIPSYFSGGIGDSIEILMRSRCQD